MPGLPKISVCIPAYNSERYIGSTLDSLLAQDYPDYEIIVSDNRSTDRTAEIVKHYGVSTSGRVRYLLADRHGTCEDNLNRCAELGDGEFVAVYHADDIYYPNALKKAASALLEDPEVGAVATLGDRIDPEGNKIGDGNFPYVNEYSDYDFERGLSETLRIGSSLFICSSVMYRRSVLQKYELRWNRKRFVTASDLGLFLEMLKHCRIKLLRERLMGYRITESQGSNTVIRRRTAKADFFRVLRRYRPEIAGNRYRNNFYFSVVKDLIVRALNFSFDGDLMRSNRRICAFFKVYFGKFTALRGFRASHGLALLAMGLFAANHWFTESFRRRFIVAIFRFGRKR